MSIVLPDFSLRFRRVLTHVVVDVVGELDALTAPQLRRRLDDLIEEQGNLHVAVDLGATTFVDSTGLTVLVDAAARLEAKGGTFTVLAPAPTTLRLLAVAGLLDRLDVVAEPVSATLGRAVG